LGKKGDYKDFSKKTYEGASKAPEYTTSDPFSRGRITLRNSFHPEKKVSTCCSGRKNLKLSVNGFKCSKKNYCQL
jgi:hypothetical protein